MSEDRYVEGEEYRRVEDRLKTLEDKVKFIMDAIKYPSPTEDEDDKTLQDLWDEVNVNRSFYKFDSVREVPDESIVKEWKCNKCGTVFDISSVDGGITSAKCSCKPTDKECKFCTTDVCVCGKRTTELDKSEKIEEIISELNEYGEKVDWDWTFHGDSLESWLRDKLKDL